jgi:GNAT superfamily N-acetyltransferase
MRLMTRVEMEDVIEWAAREGWNPGLGDATAFHATDRTGFYVGVLEGEIIASISAVKYGTEFAFVGYYIVVPEHRGKGYGRQLWQHALGDIEGVPSGLDGVLAQTGNYERSGYVTAYHNQRYRGVNPASKPLPNDGEAATRRIKPLTSNDFDNVVAFDASIFPARRERFLSLWLTQPEAVALVLREDAAVQGYGVVRPARDGWRIGPLFADHAAAAESLFDALVAYVPAGQAVAIDVPQVNSEAIAMVQGRGMVPMFETTRMYRGGVPAVDVGRVFGVTSLELG